MTLRDRVTNAGFGHLWDDFNLGAVGIVSLRRPVTLARPTVLAPCSVPPAPSHVQHVQLTVDEHKRLMVAMFGEDR